MLYKKFCGAMEYLWLVFFERAVDFTVCTALQKHVHLQPPGGDKQHSIGNNGSQGFSQGFLTPPALWSSGRVHL